ncbi:hypothetical protein BN1182_BQ_00420 [Pantoea ananatis]|nr:hypothetical protein BN1182_BQ_00420 [Pantoea ananatis]
MQSTWLTIVPKQGFAWNSARNCLKISVSKQNDSESVSRWALRKEV